MSKARSIFAFFDEQRKRQTKIVPDEIADELYRNAGVIPMKSDATKPALFIRRDGTRFERIATTTLYMLPEMRQIDCRDFSGSHKKLCKVYYERVAPGVYFEVRIEPNISTPNTVEKQG